LAEDLKQHFRPGFGSGTESQFVDDQQLLPLEVPLVTQQPFFVARPPSAH